MVKKILCPILLLVPLVLSAQELRVIASAGQQLAHGNFQLAATVGETCITLQLGADQCATEGFQQGEKRPVATDRRQNVPATQLTAYPNPTAGNLRINQPDPQGQTIHLLLYSSIGALMLQTTTTEGQSNLDLGSVAAGRYWLVVRTADHALIAALPIEKISL